MSDTTPTASLPGWLRGDDYDTVVLAFPDVYGRLMGKRLDLHYFLDHGLADGTHVCNYLMTVDMEMEPQPGFALANWDKGYGDFHLAVDAATLRPLPWQTGTALALGDLRHHDGSPVDEAPRAVLARQVERLAARGMAAYAASELEFFLFRDSYHAAAERGFRGLRPASDYLIDYHLLAPTRDEDVIGRIRRELPGARIPVEGSKGEWGKGQHEVNLVYCEALEMADRHVVFKQAVKEIADQQGTAVTFMAKWATQEAGSSSHLHFSLWDAAGEHNRFWEADQPSELFGAFLAGLIRYSRELSYCFAPTVNSYKRYQPSSWAPTALVWAHDNRTTGFRVVGEGPGLRVENRMPGADVNPYLALAATIAAGLRGVDEGLACPDPYEGNAYADAKLEHLPASLLEAVELLERSELARDSFGDDVVDFYVRTGRLEYEAYQREVGDWERARYFERI